MAQPTGQVLVDTGHALAGALFAYANDTGLWDATNGAMLAKTGTGAVAVEGGANVVTTNGTTWYTPAATIALPGACSFGFKVRTTALNNKGMVLGNPATANQYAWINSGLNTIYFNGNNAGSNPSSTTTATYYFVRDGLYLPLRIYKNGVLLLTLANSQSVGLNIARILGGHSTASYNLDGALEWVHVLAPGVVLTEAEVISLTNDPYQVLVSAAPGFEADVSGTAAVSWSGVGFVSVDVLAPPSGTITLTSPAANTMRQRSLVTGLASFTVTGSATAGGIEYRWAGGAWATLVALHPGGAYSQAVTLPTGQGALEVRLSGEPAVTALAALITVGDLFATPGQSNHLGAATSVVLPVASAFTALEHVGGVWVPLRESTTAALSYSGVTGYGGSYFGALSNRLQAQGVPVGFVPCAGGGTTIAQWQKGQSLYAGMVAKIAAVGGVRGNLLWLGESDANSSPVQATFSAGLNQHINDVWADLAIPTFVNKIVRWIPGADVVRAAQDDVIASNTHVVGWADCDVYAPSGVHYTTTTDINNVADRVYAGMVGAFFTDPATASVAGSSAVSWAGAGAVSATVGPAPVSAAVAGSAGLLWSGSGAVSVDLIAVPPGTVTALASGAAAMSWAGAGSVSATVLAVLPAVAADAQGAAAMLWAGTGGVYITDGSVIWPTHRAGTSHTAVVPRHAVRYVVEPGDELSTPLRTYTVPPGGTEVLAIDWATLYLARAADEPGTLHAVDVEAGLTATPSPALAQPVPAGVVAFTVPAPAAPGSYTLAATLATVGGRIKPATLLVQALAEVPIVKTFPLDQGATEVFEVDFDTTLLAGLHDAATELAAFTGPGAWVQAEYPPGTPLAAGVVRLRAVAPSTAGDYDVIAAVRTAAGRVQPARVVLRVNPAD